MDQCKQVSKELNRAQYKPHKFDVFCLMFNSCLSIYQYKSFKNSSILTTFMAFYWLHSYLKQNCDFRFVWICVSIIYLEYSKKPFGNDQKFGEKTNENLFFTNIYNFTNEYLLFQMDYFCMQLFKVIIEILSFFFSRLNKFLFKLFICIVSIFAILFQKIPTQKQYSFGIFNCSQSIWADYHFLFRGCN